LPEPVQRSPWLRQPNISPASFDSAMHRVGGRASGSIAQYGGATVLVVSHVTPIKTVFRLALYAGEDIL